MKLQCPSCGASKGYIRTSKLARKRTCTRCGYEGEIEEFEKEEATNIDEESS